jgi:hypothetical protein
MNVIQEINQPVTEIDVACLAAPQHGINDGNIFSTIVIAACKRNTNTMFLGTTMQKIGNRNTVKMGTRIQ